MFMSRLPVSAVLGKLTETLKYGTSVFRGKFTTRIYISFRHYRQYSFFSSSENIQLP